MNLSMITPSSEGVRARVVSYAPGAYNIFFRRCGRMKIRRGSRDWESEASMYFLRVKAIEGQVAPHVLFSSNASKQNFEIAILFKKSPKDNIAMS